MLKLIVRLAYFVVIFVEALVLTRVVLLLINANTDNAFANWVMSTSAIFVDPFEGIVSTSLQINDFSLPLTPLVALVFYVILAFALSELLKSFSRG